MILGLSIYEAFNYGEGVIWFVAAVVTPLKCKLTTRTQRIGVTLASIGFILFGMSDFFEATRQGNISLWLWAFKILSGSIILAGRFTYVGWKKFSVSDRYFRFGLFCLVAVVVLVVLQELLSRIEYS